MSGKRASKRPWLRRVAPEEVMASPPISVSREVAGAAREIVDRVRCASDREAAVRTIGVEVGDLHAKTDPMWFSQAQLDASKRSIHATDLGLLERTADRIARFATAQRGCLTSLDVEVDGGGRAGHDVRPVERAGCYAPGGRYPLPSSVLMTAVTARVAGVDSVWIASPRPSPMTLAAASVAGADGLLAVGGAQAIAALTYGVGPLPPSDLVVGPGNAWVTAAKQCVAGTVGIDGLAGPSELLVLADATADPDTVASDLLAQAEHDPDARVVLVCLECAALDAIDEAIGRQLAALPTAEIAAQALRGASVATVVTSLEQGIEVCDRVAPEHLELMLERAADVAPRLAHYGGLFVGHHSAEVFGDYGAGPNHVLPTGATSRFTGGLSVLTFLRIRTWLKFASAPSSAIVEDTARLATLEGLAGHAASARQRQQPPNTPTNP